MRGEKISQHPKFETASKNLIERLRDLAGSAGVEGEPVKAYVALFINGLARAADLMGEGANRLLMISKGSEALDKARESSEIRYTEFDAKLQAAAWALLVYKDDSIGVISGLLLNRFHGVNPGPERDKKVKEYRLARDQIMEAAEEVFAEFDLSNPAIEKAPAQKSEAQMKAAVNGTPKASGLGSWFSLKTLMR